MELEGDFDEVSPGRWAQKEGTPTKRAGQGILFLVSVIVIAASSFNLSISCARGNRHPTC